MSEQPKLDELFINRYSIKPIIMQRDGITSDEADELIADARAVVAMGEDPEEVLNEYFGLEPDYVFDLLFF